MIKILLNKLHQVRKAYARTRRQYPELAREYKRAGIAIEKQLKIARAQ